MKLGIQLEFAPGPRLAEGSGGVLEAPGTSADRSAPGPLPPCLRLPCCLYDVSGCCLFASDTIFLLVQTAPLLQDRPIFLICFLGQW